MDRTRNHDNRRKMRRGRRKRKTVTVKIFASHPNICNGEVQLYRYSLRYRIRAIAEEAILESIQDMRDSDYKVIKYHIGW